jgi:hypothetical protein
MEMIDALADPESFDCLLTFDATSRRATLVFTQQVAE